MTGGSDEVKTRMYAKIDLVRSMGLLLLQHVRLMLVIKKFDDRHPRVPVVDIIPEAGSVDDRKADYRLSTLGL